MTHAKFLIRCLVLASMTVLPVCAYAQQKTAKACDAEWRANKASIQGSGRTKKAFMVECRSGTGRAAAAQPANPAPAAPPSATAQTDNGAGQAPAPRTRTALRERENRPRPGTSISTGEGAFASVAEAKAHCPGDTVVWANTKSKIYHFAGSRAFGSTRRGAYMCERETASAGYRVAKNGKRPR
jgi:hypothetical protein